MTNLQTAGGGTPRVSTGYNRDQPQNQAGAASRKDDASEHYGHPLDKDKEKDSCYKEENGYSHTRHFPKKPENHYSHTGHLQNSNVKPENHYSQTRHFPTSKSATKKPEGHYSTTKHFPKSSTTKKQDRGVDDHVYHALDVSGEKADAHKKQEDGEDVYRALEEATGDNCDIEEGEIEYSVPYGQQGNNNNTCTTGYHVLGETGQTSDTNIYAGPGGGHEYHILEGPGENSGGTNASGVQEEEVQHEYHVLEGSGDNGNTSLKHP